MSYGRAWKRSFLPACVLGMPPLLLAWPQSPADVLFLPTIAVAVMFLYLQRNGYVLKNSPVLAWVVAGSIAFLPSGFVLAGAASVDARPPVAIVLGACLAAAAAVAAILAAIAMRSDPKHWFPRFLVAIDPKA